MVGGGTCTIVLELYMRCKGATTGPRCMLKQELLGSISSMAAADPGPIQVDCDDHLSWTAALMSVQT